MITFTQNIQPVFLVGNLILDGTVAQVSGWGATDADKGPNSEILQILSVSVTPCASNNSPSDQRQTNVNSNLCTSAFNGDFGFCTTDVGGPLVIPSGLIGLASWHQTPCGFTTVSI